MDMDSLEPQPLSALLAKQFPPDMFWLEPNILPKGGIMLFGGQAKIGKSFIALELIRALASGTSPFDYPLLQVPKAAKVLLIEQELGEYGLQKRIKTLFPPSVMSACNDNLWYLSMVPELKLDEVRGYDKLRKIVDKVKPNILVLDPISKMHNYEEQSNSQIGELLSKLSKLRKEFRELGLSIIMSHHFGKPPKTDSGKDSIDPLSPYNFRGASRWFDDVDAAVPVCRLGELTTLPHFATEIQTRWILRHGEELDDTIMTFNRKNDHRVIFDRFADGNKNPKFKVPPLSFKPGGSNNNSGGGFKVARTA